MILAASNIAWIPEERLAAYDLMQAAGLTGLEIAPALFFHQAKDPFNPNNAIAAAAIAEIEERGLSLISMQSLLFGVHGASLFGDADARSAFERGMNRAIDLAGRFGIPNLVFGSPTQRRIPEGMVNSEAVSQSTELFRRLGDRAAAFNTVISIEPNPSGYNTNFLNTLDEVERFVATVAHPAVAIVLDLGAMHMNDEFHTTAGRITDLLQSLHHVHVSEPLLAPAPDDKTVLTPVMTALRAARYSRAVSIEMKRHEAGLATLHSRITALVRASEEGSL